MNEDPSAPASSADDPEPPEQPEVPWGTDAPPLINDDAPPTEDEAPRGNEAPSGDDAPSGDEPTAERGTTRRLYREPDDRRVAGVCAGLADYVGVEPRLVRVAAIVLAVLSPITVIAYGLASLTVPQRPVGVSRTRARLGVTESQQAWIIAALGMGVVVGLAVGTWTWWGLDVPLAALALIAMGIWWLLRGRTNPARNYLAFSVDMTTVDEQSVHQDNHSGHPPGDSRGRVDAEPTYAPRPEEEGAGPPSGVPPLPPPAWSGPARGARPPVRTRFGRLRTWGGWRPGHLGMLVIAPVLIGWGTVWLLRVVDAVTVGPRVAIATGLLVAGLALVLASWRGRAGLLIPLGLLATVALTSGEIVDVPLDAGVGERTVTVERPSQLDERHELLIGDLNLDLREAPLPHSGTTFVSAGVGAGRLLIRVPADADVVVRSDVRIGQVTGDFPPGTSDSGMLVRSTERLAGGSGGPRLDLGVDVGIGEVEVVRG